MSAAVGRTSRNIDLEAGQPPPRYFVKQFETLPEQTTEQQMQHAGEAATGSLEQPFGMSQQPSAMSSSGVLCCTHGNSTLCLVKPPTAPPPSHEHLC